VGRTGLETQWVSPQERSEKSLRDFERLRSGVETLKLVHNYFDTKVNNLKI
jgi:hypothetical protein